MLTALVVAHRAELHDGVEVSAAAASVGGGGLDLTTGEVWSVEALLYALLLTSSNDAAVALAEHTAGSESAFVALMNRAARRIGATRSHFVTPHGLDRPGHHATARDLATIAARLLSDPALRSIVATPKKVVEGPGGAVELLNRNVLLKGYPGAIGVKTGFTSAAGDVLVAAAQRGGRRLMAVALGSEDAARDCRRLLERGFTRLARSALVSEGEPIGWLVFDPGGAVPATAGETVRGLAARAALNVSFRPHPAARPPFDVGDVVG
jgi:D-alanyl-D-alanine carboxypeptidase (penicillin-binding protein 5/6)